LVGWAHGGHTGGIGRPIQGAAATGGSGCPSVSLLERRLGPDLPGAIPHAVQIAAPVPTAGIATGGVLGPEIFAGARCC